ncbi:isopentenyl-diphosphate Delta-isomerase [Pedobacter sandarakinus]|uniref:isopentenyl-diphosphate Delta-isomerase n=1 Tax=Pedobacter sandarakinus TaxID=353156 RepID=UPI0022450443|nr:isopentenyl-diphosphate Delta-isomerase [Pedobacter sandarakinus]MCX2574391.1 isopentenyl-diphosphate Delta-isomerase [Pedobacter sandarakinus]
MVEHVIVVDEHDTPLGEMEKLEAHQKGVLHRAFSIFIFNSRGELLLQQRAAEKYHCAGLWTNTCCSHPRSHETNEDAAKRRLMEEMGLRAELHYAFNFHYRAEFDDGLIEHEIDHVFIGVSDQIPLMNPLEVGGCRYADLASLQEDIFYHPERYTPWLKICLDMVIAHLD